MGIYIYKWGFINGDSDTVVHWKTPFPPLQGPPGQPMGPAGGGGGPGKPGGAGHCEP